MSTGTLTFCRKPALLAPIFLFTRESVSWSMFTYPEVSPPT